MGLSVIKKKSFGIPFEGNGGEWPSLSHSFPGSVARITERDLKATDADSDDGQVIYIMKEDPGAGRLQMAKPEHPEQISVRGPVRSFTQADVNQGQPIALACPGSLYPAWYNKGGLSAWQVMAGTHAFFDFDTSWVIASFFFLGLAFLLFKKKERVIFF